MALGFQKRKLNAIRGRVSQDTSAVEAARAEGDAAGYDRAEPEIASLRVLHSEATSKALEYAVLLMEAEGRNSALKQQIRQSEAEVARQKADIALLKAAVETMKAEVTTTRMASREPRKAAVNEILAILKQQRTVARSEAVLRNMLKEL